MKGALKAWRAALLFVAMAAFSASGWAAEPIVLQWGVGQGGQFIELYQKVARMFEERHPHVRIEIVQAGYDELREKVIVAHAAGDPIDLFEAHSSHLMEMVERGIARDLGPFLAADPDVDLGGYIPVTVTGNQVNGRQVALPVAAFVDVLYINVEHFRTLGLALPPQPHGCMPDSCPEEWTWQEFADTLQRLTRDIDGDGVADRFGLQLGDWWPRTTPFLFQAGAHFFDETYSRAVLDSDEAVDALTFLQDLSLRGFLSGGGFTGGTASTYISGPWDLVALDASGIDYDVVMLPRHRHHGTRASNLPIHMSAITPYPEVAWEFIKFVISPEVQGRLTESVEWLVSSYVPAALEYVRAPGGPAGKHVFFEQMMVDPGHRVITHPALSQMDSIIQRAWSSIWRGEAAVRPALEEANRQMNAMMASYAASWERE